MTLERVAMVHYEAVTCDAVAARSDDMSRWHLHSTFLSTPRFPEGSQECTLLCTGIDSSKTNKDSHFEFTGSMRKNASPLECPHNADALLAFVQFRILGRPFPNFKPFVVNGVEKHEWYSEFLLYNQGPGGQVLF